MRLAILSDIHSNLPALESVLEAVDEAGLGDEVWCLGDVVGYGADPDRCTAVVRERCSVCLVGNHDLAALGELDIDTFSDSASAAAEWTQRHSAAETLEFLRSLDPMDVSREVALYHASPRDPVWEYVLATDQATECIDVQARRVSLIGHSHIALYFERRDCDGGEATGAAAPAGLRLDMTRGRWLVNPGSVGQPRDGDPRAAWLELDTGEWTATFHRVEYDVEAAARAIVDAGLPEQLANRLYLGH